MNPWIIAALVAASSRRLLICEGGTDRSSFRYSSTESASFTAPLRTVNSGQLYLLMPMVNAKRGGAVGFGSTGVGLDGFSTLILERRLTGIFNELEFERTLTLDAESTRGRFLVSFWWSCKRYQNSST